MKIRNQIIMTMLSILLGSMLIGGGTFAYFSATATSIGNTFAAGTIILDGEKAESVKFNFTNTQPGDTQTKQFIIDNTGSTLDSTLTVTFTYKASDPDLASQLVITSFKYGVKDALANVSLPTDELQKKMSDGKLTIQDLKEQSITLANTLAAAGAGVKLFEVGIKFNETNDDQNAYQGKSIADAKFTFVAMSK